MISENRQEEKYMIRLFEQHQIRTQKELDGHRPACPNAPYGRCGADERGLAMVSVYPIWKADHHTGQPRRGQDLLCYAPCGGLHQSKAFTRYGDT